MNSTTEVEMIVFTGVCAPMLLISDDRLSEPVDGKAEKKLPSSEQLPSAISS